MFLVPDTRQAARPNFFPSSWLSREYLSNRWFLTLSKSYIYFTVSNFQITEEHIYGKKRIQNHVRTVGLRHLVAIFYAIFTKQLNSLSSASKHALTHVVWVCVCLALGACAMMTLVFHSSWRWRQWRLNMADDTKLPLLELRGGRSCLVSCPSCPGTSGCCRWQCFCRWYFPATVSQSPALCTHFSLYSEWTENTSLESWPLLTPACYYNFLKVWTADGYERTWAQVWGRWFIFPLG